MDGYTSEPWGRKTKPAYTVLEEEIDFSEPEQKPKKPNWMESYENGSFIHPPKTNVNYPSYNDYQWQGVNGGNYPRPIPRSAWSDGSQQNIPEMSQNFSPGIDNNFALLEKQKMLGLQTEPSYPLPQTSDGPPYMNPPYGTAYPSAGYSYYDAEQAGRSHTNMAYNLSSVPYGTQPGLMDARDEGTRPPFTVPAGVGRGQYGSANYPTKLTTIPQPGYRENYGGCPAALHHTLNCPTCNHVFRLKEQIMTWALIGLVILVILLFIIVFLLTRKRR
jgi:hypothetical protein